MLYKFKSRAASDLIMLEPHGRQVLQIIGKEPGASGIILPEQVPAAVQALERAVADDEARRQQAREVAEEREDEPRSAAAAVSLRQRVAPFADMLRRSAAEGREVTWGV
ncbi:MAG: DUF1840 domain-containing protein [Burkholderiales bacterium]|jgi:hypothetical protein|nr:DUF1840 domain-containing protein [Burkholderiales bacterium]